MTAERLRQLLRYDQGTGVFTWLVRLGSQARVGSVAGTIYKNGRRYITIERKRYFAHRLAWLYVHGSWPAEQIDHVNLDRDDNRIINLREATSKQNSGNKPVLRSNRLGIKGVCLKNNKYRARIRVDGVLIHLGYFASPEDASAAYASAAVKHYGEFARST